MSIPLNYDVSLITRHEWGARPPTATTFLTSGKVTSHWEGPHMGTFPHSSCATKVRGIQNFHMDSRGWTDIAYNALACPHGFAFEGRGMNKRSAANGTAEGNSGAYAVCYLGGEGDPFTEDGKRAMKAAGDWLTFTGSTRNGHRDWKSTACPGDVIYQWTHAGQPIIWQPAPPPVPQEDKDMPYLLHNNATGGVYLIDAASGPIQLVNQSSVDAYKAAGVRVVSVIAGDADFILNKAIEQAGIAADIDAIRTDLADEEPST